MRSSSPEERTPVFYTGYDVYDWKNVGYVIPERRPAARASATTRAFAATATRAICTGRELPAAQRFAIIEYLKTK